MNLEFNPGNQLWRIVVKFKVSVFIVLILLLSACATPIDLNKDSDFLANSFKIEKSKIIDATYANFGEANKYSSSNLVLFEQGTILLTEDNLQLATSQAKDISFQQKTVLPIKSISIDMRSYGLRKQLQIDYSGSLYVIEVAPSKGAISPKATKELYQKILEMGASKWESQKYYLNDLKRDGISVPVFTQ